MDNSPPYRRAALALILGAVLSLPIAYLFLQTHSPYEAALDRIVWGLDHHDYSRWALFPALLILPGVRAFHLSQQKSYGSAGLWGYRLAFGGLVLAESSDKFGITCSLTRGCTHCTGSGSWLN